MSKTFVEYAQKMDEIAPSLPQGPQPIVQDPQKVAEFLKTLGLSNPTLQSSINAILQAISRDPRVY